jgi:hypothetical protein
MALWKSLVAGVVVAYLVFDVLLGKMADRFSNDTMVLLWFLIGICIGQANLIAAWAAFAPGSFFVRFPWAMFLAVLGWYALVIGLRWEDARFRREDALVLGAIALVGVTAAQIPLWIAAKAFRWRLFSPDAATGSDQQAERRFSLRQMLLGMAVVSVALAVGRLALPPGDSSWASADADLWMIVAVFTAVNLVVVAPCIWLAFATSQHLARLAIPWLMLVPLFSLVEFAAVTVLESANAQLEIFLLLLACNLAQCLVVFGTLRGLRSFGFRFVRLRPGNPAAD